MLLSLFGIAYLTPAFADWVKVDDFESGDVSNWETYYPEDRADPSALPTLTAVDDPFSSGAGKVLEVYPGRFADPPGSTLNFTVDLKLDAAAQIEAVENQYSTMYFKVGRPLVDGLPGECDITFGLATEAARDSTTNIFGYGSYSVLGRYEKDGIMDIRDSGSYVNLTETALGTQEYYQVWYVIDHWNNTFKQYIQGGTEFPTQTLIYPTDSNPDAGYRNLTLDNLDYILLITSAGDATNGAKGKDPIYFDDFYINPTAADLTSPGTPQQTWAGYAQDGDGNVDTGSGFLGFVNVTYAGNPDIIYSFTLNKFVYLPESFVLPQGAWMWVWNENQ
jgi:hypothetical protein